MRGVPGPHGFRQRDQRGPVIDRVDGAEDLARQVEDIARENVDLFPVKEPELADVRDAWFPA